MNANTSLLLRKTVQPLAEQRAASVQSRSRDDAVPVLRAFCFLFKEPLLFLGRKRPLLIVTFISGFLKIPFHGH